MNKKILMLFIFSLLNKNIISSKIKSFIKIKKDITDQRESLINIQFFDIKHSLINNYLNIRANLFKEEPYNRSITFDLGLPFKIGNENIFIGLKGARDDYFFRISNTGIEGNFRIYLKTLFENEKRDIKYGFQSSMAHFNDNEIRFVFLEPYLKYWYKNSNFKSKINFKVGVKEYYQAEKSISSVKEIFSSTSNEKKEDKKSFGEKLQDIERIFKIKNKKYKKTFLHISSKQKYKLMDKFFIGSEETLNYSIISINSISKIFIEVSPFTQFKYELFKNLILSYKVQFIFSHGFSVLNNSIYLLFRTSLDYRI